MSFVAVDIGPFVGLGGHADGLRILRQTGTSYPAAYAVDEAALRQYGVLGTPTSLYFDRRGELVRRVHTSLREDALRRLTEELAARP